MMKEFEFEDGSRVLFEFTEEGFAITLQATHPGSKAVKVTAARAVLDTEKLNELINWIGDTLLEEHND